MLSSLDSIIISKFCCSNKISKTKVKEWNPSGLSVKVFGGLWLIRLGEYDKSTNKNREGYQKPIGIQTKKTLEN